MTDYKRLTDKDWHKEKFYPKADNERIIRKRLWDLENKIEQGTLVELPCKVGDTLYYVNAFSPTPRIEENIVHTIEMFNARDGFNIRIWTQNGTFYANNMPNVFKTKGQAEQRLKELKND